MVNTGTIYKVKERWINLKDNIKELGIKPKQCFYTTSHARDTPRLEGGSSVGEENGQKVGGRGVDD